MEKRGKGKGEGVPEIVMHHFSYSEIIIASMIQHELHQRSAQGYYLLHPSRFWAACLFDLLDEGGRDVGCPRGPDDGRLFEGLS